MQLSASWQPAVGAELEQPYFQKLRESVEQERKEQQIFPPDERVFAALEATPCENVSVFLLGQDPYHGPGQAHGLSFSVRPGVTPPPSLANIFRELKTDLDCKVPNNGYLMPWAQQGVLLLNAVLTVRSGQPNSHKGKGWEKFTDAVLRAVNEKPDPVVFVLWGGYARKKAALIDTTRHIIVESAHPSPLSAHNGFFGSKPFSQINAALRQIGKSEIDWQIPNL